MCRHLGYLGSPRTLHELICAPPHSLEHQSYAPRHNLYNTLNADGFGVGWFDPAPDPPPDGAPGAASGAADRSPGGDRARRFRRAQPIWTDVSFHEVAEVIESSCVVAAVRSATTGFPVEESCAQPFRADGRLFSHNGVIEGFAGVEAKLRELAGDLAGMPDARAPVDSALLFALAVRRWRAGRPLGEGLADVVAAISGLAPGRYNLLAADGSTLAATTWGDSLFVRSADKEVVIASEPYDDETGWDRVPDRSLIVADESGVRIRPL
ncbi:class II glutamine amidotransferase [Actinomadura sp. HBU206391]|uniref:class II glutamine amidotransferase n=1 Tax=Actinomadura sp. HBU206391 TaxID=2731692 RepID=UPI001650BCFC|nr:class II glutamine amidotransferase [Actinomadura sp. HBU206391]MBC6460742.1 class II glutamine amidotransferase [Actinomadura sp. HBU206391]